MVTRIGVLILQLGTPDEPTPGAVRRYLREFLGDPRVIEAPRLQWWFVLNLLILPGRAPESAAKYARIWDAHTGSPLLHITRLQAQALERALPEGFVVRCGMRYGNPPIDQALTELAAAGADRIVALPMYPQYSGASTATACDRLFQALSRCRYMPALRVVPPFFASTEYIRAQAGLVRRMLANLDQAPQKIVFSFHGYPVEFVEKGDPYRKQVEETSRLLAAELKLGDGEWLLTFQSRFGRDVWLEPYTEETLCALARQGVRRVLVASPGFTTDCLETIDEVGREVAEAFQRAGGEQLVRCPCLNDDPAWIEAMKQLVLTESQGWYSPDGQGGSQ
ncbi:MAG: ferrochelatase [Planctomycetes bacterium]|nr:ferrochelatase [Planctomycetota bacterium]